MRCTQQTCILFVSEVFTQFSFLVARRMLGFTDLENETVKLHSCIFPSSQACLFFVLALVFFFFFFVQALASFTFRRPSRVCAHS